MIIELLFLLPIVLLAWLYAGYPLVLMLISKIKKDRVRARPIEPKVSIVICTNNESSVINGRIENILKQDYPREKMEIIIVDSSMDATADLVREKWMKDVMLIKQNERQGKASAINLALKKASGEIIILSDAPTRYHEDTVRKIVRNFADPRVGGVTGRYNPVGGKRRVEDGEKLFWKFKNVLRNLEGIVDSTTFFSGELCAFRRELIEKVDEDSIADDVNIAIKIRRKGCKAIYDSSAIFMEAVPANYKDFMTQKVRRAIGGIRETIRFRDAIFNPNFGLYGMLILPTRFLLTILSPFIFLSCLVAFGYFFIRANAFHLFLKPYAIVLLLFVCFLIITFRRRFPVKALTTFLITQFVQLQALIKYSLKKFSVEWEQVESTRKIEKNFKDS